MGVGVAIQVTTQPKKFEVEVNTYGYLSTCDTWGLVTEQPIHLPQLFIAPHTMDKTAILAGRARAIGGRPSYKSVSVDMGKGAYDDPLVFPFLTDKAVLQVAHTYEPVGDEIELRNRCQTEAAAMFSASLLKKVLSGKDSSIFNEVTLGHDVKEYAIKQAQPVWAAGHVRTDPATGGYCLFEDDLESTPFVLSTQPLDAVETEMKKEVDFNRTMMNVFGGLGGVLLLGATVSALPDFTSSADDKK